MLPEPTEPLLSSAGRRSWIAHNIPRSIWETQTGSSILSELRQAGLGIRESDFYDIRRSVLTEGYYEDQITSLDRDSLIPRGWMEDRPQTELTCKAQYRYKMTVTDLDTGEQTQIYRALASDRHYTLNEAEDMIRSLFTMPSATSNYTVDEVELYQVWVRPGVSLDR